jgi:hypothetical protein
MVRVSGNTWMPIGVGGNFMPGGTSGISAEYYKCASVAEPGTLSVTIPNNTELSGVYTYNSSNGRYVNTNGAFFLHDGNYWVLVGIDGYYYCQSDEIASDTTPVDATGWKLSGGSHAAVDMTVTIPKTWSGYKAVFDSGTGTWSFESDATEGLTYTNVTPIVGGIYSADALVIVSLLYTGTPTLTSPTGMTSESSDEWEISASSFYSTNSAPWKAFDGVTGSSSGWTGASNSSWWLQWQNKTKPVLVQKLRFQGTASGDIAQQAITSFILQGSDDGSTWTDLYTASGLTWTTGYEWKEFTFSNSKSYYYHRLADITVAANYPTIVELETYDM